jgi:hypothetical protein
LQLTDSKYEFGNRFIANGLESLVDSIGRGTRSFIPKWLAALAGALNRFCLYFYFSECGEIVRQLFSGRPLQNHVFSAKEV